VIAAVAVVMELILLLMKPSLTGCTTGGVLTTTFSVMRTHETQSTRRMILAGLAGCVYGSTNGESENAVACVVRTPFNNVPKVTLKIEPVKLLKLWFFMRNSTVFAGDFHLHSQKPLMSVNNCSVSI
jgi:hypothetical protein